MNTEKRELISDNESHNEIIEWLISTNLVPYEVEAIEDCPGFSQTLFLDLNKHRYLLDEDDIKVLFKGKKTDSILGVRRFLMTIIIPDLAMSLRKSHKDRYFKDKE